VKVSWCCFRARPLLENRDSPQHCWKALPGKPHTRLHYFCSPQHSDSVLYPVIAQLERAAGFVHEDGGRAKSLKLGRLLALGEDDLPVFAEFLSLAREQSRPALGAD
jgi:hypothetical protein